MYGNYCTLSINRLCYRLAFLMLVLDDLPKEKRRLLAKLLLFSDKFPKFQKTYLLNLKIIFQPI